jgi:hypothetical protein
VLQNSDYRLLKKISEEMECWNIGVLGFKNITPLLHHSSTPVFSSLLGITVPAFDRLEIDAKTDCHQEIEKAPAGRPHVAVAQITP